MHGFRSLRVVEGGAAEDQVQPLNERCDVIVYEEGTPDKEFVSNSLKAGVPLGQIELIMVVAKVTEKAPLDIQKIWMDTHVGVQQVFKELY
jgi:hypothetical protein